LARWSRLRQLRSNVLKKLEESRAQGEIGSSLAAIVTIQAAEADFTLLQSLGHDLRFVMITSEVHLHHVAHTNDISITVSPSPHQKCERCWHYCEDVGHHADHPTLCQRCVSNLYGTGEHRKHA